MPLEKGKTMSPPSMTSTPFPQIHRSPSALKQRRILQNDDSGYYTPGPSTTSGNSPSTLTKFWREQRDYKLDLSFGFDAKASFSFSATKSKTSDLNESESKEVSFDESSCSGLQSSRLALRPLDRIYIGAEDKNSETAAFRSRNLLPVIGTRMGEKYVDFLDRFKMTPELPSRIFQSLDDLDLCRTCCVSRSWRETVLNDRCAAQRRKAYLERKKKHKENANGKKAKTKNVTKHHNKPPPFNDIGNGKHSENEDAEKSQQIENPKESRFEQFYQIGQTLRPKEYVDKCPRCRSPARINDTKAICSLATCVFEFCTLCRLKFDLNHSCSPVVPRMAPPEKISIKQAKRYLRRLLH